MRRILCVSFVCSRLAVVIIACLICVPCWAGGASTNDVPLTVQEIPREGFESLQELKRFAASWPGMDRGTESRGLMTCTIGTNQAWILTRTVGAGITITELAVFSKSMGRYLMNVLIPPSLSYLTAEQREFGVVEIYQYSKHSRAKHLVLSMRELVAADWAEQDRASATDGAGVESTNQPTFRISR